MVGFRKKSPLEHLEGMQNTLQPQINVSLKKDQDHTTRSFENIAVNMQKKCKCHLTMIQTQFFSSHADRREPVGKSEGKTSCGAPPK